MNLDRVIFRGRPGVRRGLAAAACVLLPALAAPATATAAPALTATIITWNVIGLDSNDPTAGPNQFPVGVRICNTGSSAATNVATSFSWDSANANISLVEAPGRTVGTVAAGSCRDVYYTAQIARTNAAYNTARRYHVSVSADTLATINTPTPRELFVEKLVSQNRNSFVSMSGPATVRVGDTVSYTVTTKTATNGYEQLVAATLFPPSIFDTVSTSSTYPVPAGATNDKLYADGCGWDPLPTSGTYNSCTGPAGFAGGKAGGSPIVTTYTLRVIGTGTASVGTTIYDFSGSSFHYNSDFSASVTSITALPNTPPVAVNDAASTTPGTAVAVSVLGNDSDADGDTLTVTGSTTPTHGSVTCTTSQCTYTPTAGFSGTDTFTYSIADGHGGTATATVTVTVGVALPALGVGTPLPVIVLVVALGAAAAVYRRRTIA